MYTLLDCIKHKCRDSYVLYIPTDTVHAFGLVLLTHTLLVQTHTHDVSAPWCQDEIKLLVDLKFKGKINFKITVLLKLNFRALKLLSRPQMWEVCLQYSDSKTK